MTNSRSYANPNPVATYLKSKAMARQYCVHDLRLAGSIDIAFSLVHFLIESTFVRLSLESLRVENSSDFVFRMNLQDTKEGR